MRRFLCPAFFSAVVFVFACPGAFVQTVQSQIRITTSIDESQLKTFVGNTHPLARSEFDRGVAPADLPMERMLLVLSRSAEQETALRQVLDAQQDPSSSLYHNWLTPQEFGQRFGAADQDIQVITSWLQSHGFRVNRVSNGCNVIEFSGTADQVQGAFHTEIHRYVVNGQSHWANASDPRIPAALAPVITGILTLHNFGKKLQLIASKKPFEATVQAGSRPQFTGSAGSYALAPADYATIYNINPLYQSGINGTGTTIAVVARTNIDVSDVNQFRSTFALPSNPPQIVVNGTDPGDLGGSEEAEAVLDSTWAGAVAPSATVKLVVSASTNTTDGVDLSEEYIIDNSLGDVMTESFGDCEAHYSQAEASFYSSLAEQATSEGITYTVAAGDSGAEGCDDPTSPAAQGPISVNILASSPYTVAVGGTEFNENGNYAAYWSPTNGAGYGSALSYIPEDVWNESCTAGTCTAGNNPGLWAGGGGASVFFSKPSWQSGVSGIPGDGARDLPDVSLTAAGHDAYLLCLDGSCTPDQRGRIYFEGYSGTSAATPSFAGIAALIVQKMGSRQGQINYVLYPLAATEVLAQCNASSLTGLPASNCIFHNVTVGNNAVPGEPGYGTPSADYQAGAGYNLATGLGSVNVTNLVNQWSSQASLLPRVRLFIDNPGSQNSTVIGLSYFAGWAVSDTGSISNVAIAVDGVPYGSATYGTSRPDVCNVYPGRAGCPNVGWYFAFDTTLLSDGTHSLDVTATSSSGQNYTFSSSFTAANWTTANPMLISIDTPSSSSGLFSGVARFGGWAIDSLSAIAQVAVSIDGASYGNAAYGGSRPDVCNAYPNEPGCPNVGWNFQLDTTLLADGTHTIAITPTTQAGQHSTATAAFTVSNSANDPFSISIDRPNSQSGSFSGAASFGGWAISKLGAISQVAVSIDGLSYGNATYGGSRPDVCAVYTGIAGCPNVGWSFAIDTTRVANGNHTMAVTASAVNPSTNAVQHATVSASFSVANAGSGLPMKMFIDQPSAQASTVIGLNTFYGWTIDDNGAITKLELSADGNPLGNANYGTSRPDVCNAYPGRAGCPNVGWTYTVDTTLIPDGTHTLALTGTSAAGDVSTVSTTFTVANWTTANPMKISIDSPNAQSGALSGMAPIGGWAISDIAAISTIAVAVDGVSFGNAVYGSNRADVCAVYPGRAGCPNVGWNFALNTTQLADGNHTLEITGTSTGGQHSTFTRTFTVSNSAGNPIQISIDRPAANGTLTGTAAIGGWAVDTNSGIAISSVQVLVDGVISGTATYGASRPDVCAIYSTASGCPNVGWNFVLDTTVFSNGTHSLEVRATSAAGQQATVSTPFNVVNQN